MKVIAWTPGMIISEPGIYRDVPMSVYHSQEICDGPSISSSGLRRIWNESAAHFFSDWDGNPEREERRRQQKEIADRLKASGALDDIFAKIDAGEPLAGEGGLIGGRNPGG
jgi:hypothetical protein